MCGLEVWSKVPNSLKSYSAITFKNLKNYLDKVKVTSMLRFTSARLNNKIELMKYD